MNKIKYAKQKRDDSKSILDYSANNIIITDTLKDKFRYIYDNLINEKYQIRLGKCDKLDEIVYDDMTVGFATYTIINKTQYILTNVYIMPEYRYKSVFKKYLKQQLLSDNHFSIYQPSHYMISLLLKYEYATKLNDTLILSSINFILDKSSTVNFNGRLNEIRYTNLYDLNMCACISLKIYDYNNYDILYTDILAEDNKYLQQNSRKNTDENYFRNIVRYLIDNDSVIERKMVLLNYNYPRHNLPVEKLIGSKSQLKGELNRLVVDNIISYARASDIQKQLYQELRNNLISKQALNIRINYLANNINKPHSTIKNEEECPYCREQIDYTNYYCHNCGYIVFDIENMSNDNFIYENTLKEKQSYKYSLRGVIEKKKYFTDEYKCNLAMIRAVSNILGNNYNDELFSLIEHQLNIKDYDLKKLLLANKYISYKITNKNEISEALDLKADDLKKILKKNNLKASGTKRQLKTRIINNIPINELDSKTPKVTKKGQEFFEDNNILQLYDEVFDEFIYEEFMDSIHESENLVTDLIKFMDKHMEVAIKTRNHDQLDKALHIKALLCNFSNDIEEVFKSLLERFVVNINMMYIDSNYYSFYNPVTENNIRPLAELKQYTTNADLDKYLNQAYKKFDVNELKISYHNCYKIFDSLHEFTSTGHLNNKIKKEYYADTKKEQIDKITRSKITTLDSYFK